MPRADRQGASQRGLTLIEVLVAIAILAAVIGTFLSLMSLQARNTIALDQRVMARIVAENAMVDAVTDIAAERTVTTSGRTEMGRYVFDWQLSRTPAPVAGAALLTVTVRPEGEADRIAATLSTLTEAER